MPSKESSSPADEARSETKRQPPSTLIEFPRNGRTPVPAWRKELSERVREVQARKAREAELENGPLFEPLLDHLESIEEQSPSLGLVPPLEVNPIVARALERIENARQTVFVARSNRGTALAVARAMEEPVESAPAPMWPMPVADPVAEPAVVVEPEIVVAEAPDSAPAVEPPIAVAPLANEVVSESASQPNLFAPVEHVPVPAVPVESFSNPSSTSVLLLDAEFTPELAPVPVIKLRRHDEEIIDEAGSSLTARGAAGVVDLMLVIFATAPFAAVIEITGGNWSDYRVGAALLAIGGIVMVLYQAATVALAGRTWGMSLFSLRVADMDFGLYPSFGQSLLRAIFYLLSLATLGLGLLYAFFNADGLTAHDRISGTVVVRNE